MRRIVLSAIAVTLLAFFAPTSAHAQATRTWISGVGDDANPCSRTAPCKTFAGAISKTATGGEIDCLDPGGFGGVTITQSITFDCTATLGSILVSGTNGITVNGAGAHVIIRGLAITGIAYTGSPGLAGVKVFQGASLTLINDHIFGFGGGATPAVDIEPGLVGGGSGSFKLDIVDTTIDGNLAGAVLVKPATGWTATASLTRVNMYTSTYGLRAEDNSKVTVFQSIASDNTNNGYLAVSSGAAVEINVTNSIAANNGTNGIATSGAPATIRLVNTAITDNATGINTGSGGTVIGSSPATSLNAGNATPGAPNGAAAVLQ